MAKLVGGVHVEHPGYAERLNGAKSRVYLAVDRGLKSGKLDEVDLDRKALLQLLEDGARALRQMEPGL